jgi:prepilin-type N-terminal cleavage/methylation domain-containing protein/prepilin-type processing-associated H-X9-DG protein
MMAVKEIIVKRKNGFTLIELLVVIAIIALLLGVLIPALQKAKEMGRRVVCLSIIKSYGTANMIYAEQNNSYAVPFSQASTHVGPLGYWDERWPENMDFRNYLSLSARVEINDDGWEDPFLLPEELMCPAQRYPKTEADLNEVNAALGWKIRFSYALNTELWAKGSANDLVNWYPSDKKYRGHKLTQMKNPSGKLMFIDSNYYQSRYERSDYRRYWDPFGDTLNDRNWGQIAYRHSGGASVAFFDGHADYYKKEKVFNTNNPVPLTNIKNRYPDSLWDVE